MEVDSWEQLVDLMWLVKGKEKGKGEAKGALAAVISLNGILEEMEEGTTLVAKGTPKGIHPRAREREVTKARVGASRDIAFTVAPGDTLKGTA